MCHKHSAAKICFRENIGQRCCVIKVEAAEHFVSPRLRACPNGSGDTSSSKKDNKTKGTDLRSEVGGNDCIALIYHTVCSWSIFDCPVSWVVVVVYFVHSESSFPLQTSTAICDSKARTEESGVRTG